MSINYDVPVFRTPEAVGEIRRLQSLQQREADWVEHDGEPEQGSERGQPRPADRLRPSSTFGTATGNTVTNLNNGNINALSALIRRRWQAGGRTILVAGRVALLDRKNRGMRRAGLQARPLKDT